MRIASQNTDVKRSAREALATVPSFHEDNDINVNIQGKDLAFNSCL